MKHKALARFNKHLTRIFWVTAGVWLIVFFHPAPATVEAIAILSLWAVGFLDIGAVIADRIIRKYEEKQ